MPFGIYDVETDTVVKRYDNATEAYKDVMELLVRLYPKGYIDVALFIHERQHVPIRDAERRCVNRELYYCEWHDSEREKREQQLREICRMLLKHTGCEFDEEAFKAALLEFDKGNVSL
jgi:hypothetical protein